MEWLKNGKYSRKREKNQTYRLGSQWHQVNTIMQMQWAEACWGRTPEHFWEVQPQGQKVREKEVKKIERSNKNSPVWCPGEEDFWESVVEAIPHEGQVKHGEWRAMGLTGKKSLTLKKPNWWGLLKSWAQEKTKTKSKPRASHCWKKSIWQKENLHVFLDWG